MRRSPILRSIALAAASYNLFAVAGVAIYQFFVLRELEPTIVGFIFMSNGAGALLGGVVSSRVPARFDYGAAIVDGGGSMVAASMIVSFAGGSLPWIVVLLVAASLVAYFGRVVFNPATLGAGAVAHGWAAALG